MNVLPRSPTLEQEVEFFTNKMELIPINENKVQPSVKEIFKKLTSVLPKYGVLKNVSYESLQQMHNNLVEEMKSLTVYRDTKFVVRDSDPKATRKEAAKKGKETIKLEKKLAKIDKRITNEMTERLLLVNEVLKFTNKEAWHKIKSDTRLISIFNTFLQETYPKGGTSLMIGPFIGSYTFKNFDDVDNIRDGAKWYIMSEFLLHLEGKVLKGEFKKEELDTIQPLSRLKAKEFNSRIQKLDQKKISKIEQKSSTRLARLIREN